MGLDFVYDNLVEGTRANGALGGAFAAAVLALCVYKDMLWGLLAGIAAAQAMAWWQRRQSD